MGTVLVTGATGMLGSYVVQSFARHGWHVRALVRDPARADWLAPLGAACVRGDIVDAASLRDAVKGCEAIVHCAAAVGPGGAMEPYRTGNVTGTSNVIDAAEFAGARLVHVSSTAVYSRDTRMRFAPVTEDVTLGTFRDGDVYGTTKLEAERLVLAACASGRVWASVVRPPPMYGERDRQLVPRFAPFLMRGFFPLIGGGRAIMTAAFAGSVADGTLLAATIDRACGRVYNLTNDFDVTVADFARFASEGLERRIATPSVPHVVGRIAMRALSGAFIISGHKELAPHTVGLFDVLTRDNPFSSARARTELGWQPAERPELTIPTAFRWWKAHHGSA